ncbi:MAG: DUF362 domain-containing protein [Spirochaetes bacterium]|nr:DUF362 domain-containing protein [Spirochaetota bacterium]
MFGNKLFSAENKIKKNNKMKKSNVIVIRHKAATDKNGKGNPTAVKEMLELAMLKLTAMDSVTEAWKKFISPHDIVGIKINTMAEDKGPCTQPVLAYAIAEQLINMGVKENNIVIWDRIWEQLVAAGYKINMSDKGIRCFGTNSFGKIPLIGKKHKRLQYEMVRKSFRSIKISFSKIFLNCTAIINVPVLKDHGIAGVTLSMKNFLGVIMNPSCFHEDINSKPYIPDLNTHFEIQKRYKLTICDALIGLYNGGPTGRPQWQWPYNGIIVGKDRVAVDSIGWKIIEAKRKEMKLKSLKEAGREPSYISIAAGSGYNLGTNNINQISLVEEELD